jgi:hypothetical protein
MHPTQVRVHHFYVPNRIVFPEWEQFITGGKDGLGDGASLPTLFMSSRSKGDLLDHLGVSPTATNVTVNALPVYAFNKIFNEFYADQDLVTERLQNQLDIPNIAWEKDYFGVARPWTQRGPDVSIPVGGQAPVTMAQGSTSDVLGVEIEGFGTGSMSTSGSSAVYSTFPGDLPLYADLSAGSAGNVNDWRAAFSLQRYQEARARYGARFTEYLRYLGIRPSDARLQRPEYLGGGSTRINFSEVLQTGPNESASPTMGIGDMFGHGIAGVRSNRYRKFFEEHGYVISLLSIRPKSVYVNGIPREWLKTTKEDYYQKELANLGQQEVYTNELYGAATNIDSVFGYTDRYEEYRNQPSQVAGDFRDTLNAWHMGRDLANDVALNESFITCDPTDRIFQVGEDVADTLWIMVNNKMVARRMVPKRANPRIL